MQNGKTEKSEEIKGQRWVWCMRKGFAKRFMLSVSACIAYQKNPNTKCNKTCQKEKNALGIGLNLIGSKKASRTKR